jgi:glycerol-3-phosphate dehydrogenase (NAD(P)+)
MNVKVGIVGRGEIGSVLGEMFERGGTAVLYWDREAAKSTVSSLAELGKSSDVVFIATPSSAVGESAAVLAAAGKPGAIVALAKGVEPGFKTMDAVLRARAPGWAYGLLYGPMLAEELSTGNPSAAILALSDINPAGGGVSWHEPIARALAPQLRVEMTEDVTSIALCGALKNCYAIALGIADGLALGMNAKGALAARIVGEMEAILTALDADPRAAHGLAGLADIVATGLSEHSANHAVGIAAAHGAGLPHAEGVNTLREVPHAIDLSSAPILQTTRAIICDGAGPESIKKLI